MKKSTKNILFGIGAIVAGYFVYSLLKESVKPSTREDKEAERRKAYIELRRAMVRKKAAATASKSAPAHNQDDLVSASSAAVVEVDEKFPVVEDETATASDQAEY